jgi:hypothetical protein
MLSEREKWLMLCVLACRGTDEDGDPRTNNVDGFSDYMEERIAKPRPRPIARFTPG